MFRKALIAEDFGSITKMLQDLLKEMGIFQVDFTQYCDDAYLKIKSAIKKGEPYDLLIADLSFKKDHRPQKYATGEELIKILRQEKNDLKIIVFSMEEKPQRVKSLVLEHKVNAYVCKGRDGVKQLQQAIRDATKNRTFLSPQIAQAMNDNHNLEIEDYDIALLQHLAKGYLNKEISKSFEENKIIPSSVSSIEKRLNKLRIQFKANNAVQLVAVAKDLGLI